VMLALIVTTGFSSRGTALTPRLQESMKIDSISCFM